MDFANKTILYVPIVSMRSYDTNEYDLTSDGNVNRFLSFFVTNTSYDKLTIVLPSKITEKSRIYINKVISKFDNIEVDYNDNYPIGGASVIRTNCIDLFHSIDLSKYNLIIYESQDFGKRIERVKRNYGYSTIYWCPVSCTNEITPSFLAGLDIYDKYLAEACELMIVSTKNQYKYFKDICHNIYIYSQMINPSLDIFNYLPDYDVIRLTDDLINDEYKLVYVPFRLTDSGYKVKDITEKLKSISDKYKICVLFSDPNDSNIYVEGEFDGVKYVKVSTDRNTYYTFLSMIDCIVPYLEDISNIKHASWDEMEYFGTKTITDINEIENEFNRKKLICFDIEGFDRIGKDTTLQELTNIYKDKFNIYKQESNDLIVPDYRDKDAFIKFLKKYNKDQIITFCRMAKSDNKNMIMSRLFVSDYVYGNLFHRQPITERYRRIMDRYYDIVDIILTWKDYDEYVKRCKAVNDIVEYSDEEFDDIINLYINCDVRDKEKYYINDITNDIDKEYITNKILNIINNYE